MTPRESLKTPAVRAALLGMIGAVIAAVITTAGTIWVALWLNNSELAKARADVKSLQVDAAGLKLASVPVGTIIASLLDPAQFAVAAGDPSNFDIKTSKWTLADRRALYGTKYAELKKDPSLLRPDLRGVFLRGRNAERFKDIEESVLGTYRPDQVGPHGHVLHDPGHTHPIAVVDNQNGQGEVALLYQWQKRAIVATPTLVKESPSNIIIDDYRGIETAPRNVTVNYYIRIN